MQFTIASLTKKKVCIQRRKIKRKSRRGSILFILEQVPTDLRTRKKGRSVRK